MSILFDLQKKENFTGAEIAAAQTIRRNELYKEYRDFSREFGLPEQINRVYTGMNAKRFSGGTQAESSNIMPVTSDMSRNKLSGVSIDTARQFAI